MEEPETVSEKQKSHFLKRKKSGSGILKRLSLTGNKKRESIIYKQMKDDVDNVSEVLLDPDDSSNVRFKRSIIQINRSNNSTPIKESGSGEGGGDSKPGLFERFRASFRRRGSATRSHSTSPNSAYDALESDHEEEHNKGIDVEEGIEMEEGKVEEEGDGEEEEVTIENTTDDVTDVVASQEAQEYSNIAETAVLEEEEEILSQHSIHSPDDSVEGRTAYKFSSMDDDRAPTWKQRLYSSFRKSKKSQSTQRKSITSEPTSPVQMKRRLSLPTFKRKKKGMVYEAL